MAWPHLQNMFIYFISRKLLLQRKLNYKPKALSTLSQKSATVLSQKSETVAENGDCRTFLRQCGQGLSSAY